MSSCQVVGTTFLFQKNRTGSNTKITRANGITPGRKELFNMNKFYKAIRIITVAPVLATLTAIITAIFCENVFPSGWHILYSILFLGVLPLLAYPLQKYIPGFKDKGREGQRNLAILFAAIGFTLGCIVSFAFPSSVGIKVIFAEYFTGSMLILIFNKVFHVRLSGHSCGAVAPIVLFTWFELYVPAVITALLAVLVFLASIKMKRHTPAQLLGGSAVPVVSIALVLLLAKLF